MLRAEDLATLIRTALPDAEVEVADTTGTGDHFQARVISGAFEGKAAVERHRLVYGPLTDKLGSGALHALALQTFTPGEWAKRRTES